jgi:multiple sugar transport system substrate-binding protein
VNLALFIPANDGGEAFSARAAAFHDAQPRVTIGVQALTGDYPTVIRTHAAAGTLADLAYLRNLLFEGLALGGQLRSISPLVTRDRVDLSQWYPNGIAAMRVDGALYGLPARGQIQDCYLFYNRTAFQQAGVAEPSDAWTLEELVAAADRLTTRDTDSRFGYGTVWGGFPTTIAALRHHGGDLLSSDGQRSVVGTPQALAAMQWPWTLWHRRQVAVVKAATIDDFTSGGVAMLGQGSAGTRANVRAAVADKFGWSMILMPRGPARTLGADLSVGPLAINAATRAPDETWQALQWLTDRETGVALALQTRGTNVPGMRPDVYADPRLLDDPNYPPEIPQRISKAMEQGTGIAYVVPANFRQVEVNDVVAKYTGGFLENRLTPTATTMQDFSRELQVALDLPRGSA